MQLYFILSLIASILLVIFAVTNATAVPVSIFFTQYNFSLALIIFISTAFGAVIATLLGLVKQFKLKKQIKKLNTDNQALVLENTNLKEQK
jgi:lipopolysaccharide assembly protein A